MKGSVGICQRRGKWYCRVKIDRRAMERQAHNKRHAKTVEARVRAAVSKLLNVPTFDDYSRALREALGEQVGCGLTMKLLLTQYSESLRDLKPTTLKTHRQRIAVLKKADWADCSVGGFGRAEVAVWATKRRRTVSGGTLMNDLSVASTSIRWAEGEGLIDEGWNPFLDYRRKSIKKVTRKRRTALTEDELLALDAAVREVSPEFHPFFLAAISTGWRLGDLSQLEWRDVDLPKLTTRPETEKNGYQKVAYAPIQLADYLEKRGTPRARVFAMSDGRPWTSYTVRFPFWRALDYCVKRRQLPEWKRTGDRHVKPFDFHSLRHTVRSVLAERRHNPYAVGEVMGQQDAQTAMRYSHAYDSAKKAIATDLSAVLAGPCLAERQGFEAAAPQGGRAEKQRG